MKSYDSFFRYIANTHETRHIAFHVVGASLSSMQHLQVLWRQRLDGAFFPSPTLSDEGIVLGAATLICQASEHENAVENGSDRMHCLLSIATRRSPEIETMVGLRKALKTWQSGQKGLAQIYLEHSRPRGVIDQDDAWRLFLAEILMMPVWL